MANPPLAEDSPEYRWISRTIRTVEKRLGGSAGWNGAVGQDLAWSDGDRMAGGTMIVRDDTVLDPLRRAVRPEATAEETAKAAAAISIVARETAAAIAGPAASQDELALVLGTAETWSHRMRADLVDDIGLVEAVPSLAGHTPASYDLHYHATGAAVGLINGLSDRTKQPHLDIAHRILTASPDRWKAIADIAVDLRVAGKQRETNCATLAGEGRARYSRVMDLLTGPAGPKQRIDAGFTLGSEVAEHLVSRMDGITPSAPGYLWAERVIRAVEQRTGLPTRWNGRIYPTTNPEEAGAVYPDDTMALSEDYVIAPVRKAYAQERPLTEAELIEAVDAVHYVGHESAHASGPHLAVIDNGLDPVDRSLEEGLAEVWSFRNCSSIVQDIGMDADIPAIGPHAAPKVLSYVGYGNAAFGLVDDLAVLSDRPADEITLELLAAEPAERWGLIADLALDKQLPDLPDGRRRELRAELAAALRKDYEPVVALQAEARSPSRAMADIQSDSHDVGRRSIARLADRIGAVVSQGDPGAEVSPEIKQLRTIAFVSSTRVAPGTGTPAPAERGGAAVARPVTTRSRPGNGRGTSRTRG